jgi:hypothetical protein
MQASSSTRRFLPARSAEPSTVEEIDTVCPDDVDDFDDFLDTVTQQFEEDCPEECNRYRDSIIIIVTSLLCLVPIVALIVSAFTAVPGSEPGSDGLASEESTTMRAFTMGWLFCLALKLRREFVGLAGSSSLLEPW